MSDTRRDASKTDRRAVPGESGSPDFHEFMLEAEDRLARGADLDSPSLPDPQVEMAAYVSEANEGSVWVRRDSNGEPVRAKRAGYPADFVFEPGDETGIELVDGVWRTIPEVAYTARLDSRIEWWIRNRNTGRLRFLVERSLR